jgi:hypothetical protein
MTRPGEKPGSFATALRWGLLLAAVTWAPIFLAGLLIARSIT